MKNYQSPIGYDDVVNVAINGTILKWATVTAVKFEPDNIKCDVLLQSGVKLYDLNIVHLQLIEDQAKKINDSELA